MNHHPQTPLTEQAAALIASVERSLADGEQQLRALGLDPAKVRAMAERLNPAQQQEADAAWRADLQAVEQEVAEEKARLAAAAAPGPGAPRKARRFI
jgi:hypothetical protein